MLSRELGLAGDETLSLALLDAAARTLMNDADPVYGGLTRGGPSSPAR